jgi:hypothetical protein
VAHARGRLRKARRKLAALRNLKVGRVSKRYIEAGKKKSRLTGRIKADAPERKPAATQ